MPFIDHVQLSVLKPAPAKMALYLSARGLRNTSWPHQDNGVHLNLVLLAYRLADSSEHFREVGVLVEFDLLHYNQAFQLLNFDREGGATSGPQSRMTLLDTQFDVLRIVIPAANHNEVFQTASEVQMSVV